MKFTIRAPATSANLGPGFDAAGLALDLWNETAFEILTEGDGRGQVLVSEGFGAGELPVGPENLVLKAFNRTLDDVGRPAPGLRASATNGIPLRSGLGSSAAAVVTGILAANAFLGGEIPPGEQLSLAAALEGHPDNAAAALFGGLAVAAGGGEGVLAARVEPPGGWQAGIVLPDLEISTGAMRAALPETMSRADAVFNISRAMLLLRAIETGDDGLLLEAMTDRIHQPHRLPLIRGAAGALAAGRAAGAAAALSGAGPALVALSTSGTRLSAAVNAMARGFRDHGVDTWVWTGGLAAEGAVVGS